ncbi:ABC transporter ATP-binding protein [Microbacterium sp. VKM Ac-2923]|uniref:ATP-binding cassette domain-containing protein n=1 Tax=Microbacterium sp. VKM Ac-2923 TaxID=2929476 RepID=UPI001FB3B1D2|nr:ABC transporter ATP-binding protein [Microbacterium sp. VKM Ac-2923]MCJ1707751.1 ABC transporter ATP-binding protein [Microbacterium sp. VKM Ac-2923]
MSILRDVDLDICAGTIVAVVGPSGCGASTLLRLATGAEHCDAGTVTVDGHTGAAAPRVPAVLDRSPALRFGRALASITTAARHAGVVAPEAEAERLCALVGLRAGDAPVSRLALGDRQRWALAKALAARPRALVLDDALAALHTTARAQTRDRVVRELRERGVTTLWATRDTAEAAAVADELVVLDGGRIVATGSPADVYRRLGDTAVAEVLGPVSAVPGIVEGAVVEVWGQRLALAVAAHDGHCEVVLRPEDVVLVSGDTTGVDAIVEETTFLGSVRRSTVVTADGSRVVIEHPAEHRLDVDTRARIALAPVPVNVRPRD